MTRAGPAAVRSPVDVLAAWRDEAVCASHEYPEWFTSDRRDEQRAAIAVCAGCPVAADCLRAAISLDGPDDWNVAGGTTRKMRRAFRRGLPWARGWRWCSVQDCDRRARANGLCSRHYEAERRGVLGVTRPYVRQGPKCSEDGCTLPPTALGRCGTHYARDRRAAAGRAVTPTKQLPPERLTRGRPCSEGGCDRRAECWGMCAMHAARERRRRTRARDTRMTQQAAEVGAGQDPHFVYPG